MRLLFDHGTLVLAEPPELDFGFVPGLVWDERVALFRAPAYRYAEVVEALSQRGLPLAMLYRSDFAVALSAGCRIRCHAVAKRRQGSHMRRNLRKSALIRHSAAPPTDSSTP